MEERGPESRSAVVAMSGGVDSCAAAAALVEEGWRVVGVTFRMWEDASSPAASGRFGPGAPSAVEAAAHAASTLGIEHRVVDLRERFLSLVVEAFAVDYMRGRTPNPCVECNRRVKFPTLVEAADGLGACAVATGHYARTGVDAAGTAVLMRAASHRKDQSYALYGLQGETLSRCLFPNGGRSKAQVREAALSWGMAFAHAVESQEICFLCGGDYRGFISRCYPEAHAPGPILDTSGKVLGEHRGIAFYTVGQRRGLGVSRPYPLYVTAIDPLRRSVILGSREEVPGRWLRAEAPHWTGGGPAAASFEAEAMVRYNSEPERCRVEASAGSFEVFFGERVWALTPGQHAVLYRGDDVLGGGVIASAR